ncbi:hypothetical protein B0T10DRAFT_585904 [Thelonectria olida]|uniref:Rho-GAP domain-containing protein n=1 Tax=Thelonectria olida TaxID=1576542 RepID=A0A9P8VSZ2_9HYPO|nr:hypothetical protein B0T10DRAFT_585904 [Thelonectria olida]
MADPLSTAASVIGLLTAAAQISKILASVIDKARHAPQECSKIKTEVDDITNVLGSLQLFIMGTHRASRSRTSLIMVDQVVATLAATVSTFSELDTLATALQVESEMNLLDRLRWASKEKDIKGVLVRLESHKSSLTLMLTILTCQSQNDAERDVDRLCNLVEQTLLQNVMLKERLAAWEPQKEEQNQLETMESRLNRQTLDDNFATEDAAPNPDSPVVNERPKWQRNERGFAFEEILMSSRAYRITARDNSDGFSVITSAGRTASWSMLSGLSLSEVSHIGIQAIPIYASDITNKDHYDFSPAICGSMSSQSPPRSSPQGLEKSSRRKWLKGLFRSAQSVEPEPEPRPAVFGVSLGTSIAYAKATITRSDADGNSVVYGYIPIAVAKTGNILKQHGKSYAFACPSYLGKANGGPISGVEIQDVFAINGNPVRMSSMQRILESPPMYGRQYDWDEFTVHDTAGVLLRYLKSLPEPIIPYDHFARYVEQCNVFLDRELDEDEDASFFDRIRTLILELPALNRQLLIYLLDIMAVFASKSDRNKMTPLRLVSIFQPSILSDIPAAMDAEAHRVAAQIVVAILDKEVDIGFM